MRRIIIADPAEDDLKSIWDFIAADSVDRANQVIAEIHLVISTIAQVPGMGHTRSDIQDDSFRFRSVYSYMIAYQYNDDHVVVYKVIHGARDLREIFDD